MEILHQDENRILVGNHEDSWITIMFLMSNGHIGKIVVPDSFADKISLWLSRINVKSD